jgi:succinate dehydrogenase/fumarate reductase-like Fe-S protein
MKPTENVKTKGKIRALTLKRETLRELDAGELKQAQGGRRTYYCFTDFHCTRACPKK